MPRPKRPTRGRRRDITDFEWAFINDLIDADDDPQAHGGTGHCNWKLEWNSELCGFGEPTFELWEAYGPTVVQRWAAEKPGTRPRQWWNFTAPRGDLKSSDHTPLRGRCWAEPRRRLGGKGTPLHEVLAYSPSFDFGLPTMWPEPEHSDGTVASGSCVNGVPVGRDYIGLGPKVVLLDPNDPPLFEAQAAYLDRHGLLLPGERERLTDEDFKPEAVIGWSA